MTIPVRPAPAAHRPAGRFATLLLGLTLAACGSPVAVDELRVPATSGPSSVGNAPASAATPASPTPMSAPSVASSSPSAVAPATASPVPTAAPTPEPPRRAFAINLYRPGDFVAQFTNEWCVGASLQMTLNMTTAKSHVSRASQRALWKMAQARSFSPFGGANPRGWTAVLNDLGVGPYVLVSIPTFDGALQVAAAAIRDTRRPVGLVMWHGRHAWVMSGFESIGDPRVHDDVKVTGIRVLDPLYPHGSSAWGPSPKPNALVKPATLAKQFVLRDSSNSSVDLGVSAGFLLVLPTK
jgi:hypothetical protein